MPPFSVFDIAGPIMVGPSSSHTAGACKIGQFARALFDKTPERVTFYLHGSFGSVYKGHATDRALLAGVMKFSTSDPRLKNSFEIAKEKGITYEFKITDLGPDRHPNSVKIVLQTKGKKPMSVMGSSIGGGSIIITNIDHFDVDIRSVAGKYKTLVVKHFPYAAVLPELTRRISKKGIRVEKVESSSVNGEVLSVLSTEGRKLRLPEVFYLETIPGVEFVRSLTKLEH